MHGPNQSGVCSCAAVWETNGLSDKAVFDFGSEHVALSKGKIAAFDDIVSFCLVIQTFLYFNVFPDQLAIELLIVLTQCLPFSRLKAILSGNWLFVRFDAPNSFCVQHYCLKRQIPGLLPFSGADYKQNHYIITMVCVETCILHIYTCM